MNGPSSIPPGQTVTYTVTEHLRDGTSRVLPTANWFSSNTSLVQITNAGVATAQSGTGEVFITVRTTLQSGKEVMVLPDGTFRLVGQVMDADQPNLNIPDARVEVVGGPATATSSTGGFRLYGVPPDATIRVSRHGYGVHEERIQITRNSTWNFRLAVDTGVRNFSGNYTLVVEAAANCTGPRPLQADLKQRTYDATVIQNGSRLQVRLTEPRFISGPSIDGNRFDGTVTPSGANFTIAWDYYYSGLSEISERLSGDESLLISGSATTTEGGSGVAGPFSGDFSHYSTSRGYLGGCQASSFTLTRR